MKKGRFKVIGMAEFRNYCAENPGNSYVYDTENVLVDINSIPDELQNENLRSLSAVHQTSHYAIAVTMLAPFNSICFANQNGEHKDTLTFHRVKEIRLKKGSGWDVIRIRLEGDPNKVYVILADHEWVE
ncbi:MAG: hypothetical protein LUE89_06370 [Clostridiales bacterium]|nr:hypothetical protein [Clostridiales bacterium]